MRFLLSIFVSIIAIAATAIYQQDNLLDYMQRLLRTNVANAISKNIKVHQPTHTKVAMAPNSTFVGLPVIPPEDPSLNAANPKPRAIQQVFLAREQAEGAGATVRRSIGTPKLRNFTPFLMLDHFDSPPGSGFPDHPHRGQETITYVLKGAIDHEDFVGNKGTIEAGDLQFMTAGRGIVHAEMPRNNADGSNNAGMQLWVDLPKDLKSTEPRYRDLKAKEIPAVEVDDGKVSVKVISGRSHGVDSVQELAYTPVWFLDITIRPGGKISQPLPAAWNSFAYTMEGKVVFDTGATTQEVDTFHNTVFEQKGDQIIAQVPADAKQAGRFILVAGMPLDQPIVQYGPFVLTDPSQVRQAMMDYSTFTNGFERANGWQSEIGKVMM
jgi:quercetin 2,3-dioxygenase